MMRKLIPFLVAAVALGTMQCGNETPAAKLESFDDSLSYSYGVQLAEMLKQQDTLVNADIVALAVKEALGNNAQLTVDKCRELMQANATKKSSEAASETIEKGRVFMDENAKKEGVIVTESGLQYRMLTEGTGESPLPENTVTFHYKLSLTDGNQIESSFDTGEPITYPLNRLIPGWIEGMQLMKVGGKMELVVPSDLGYGPNTSGPIPGGSVLVFEIELVSIEEAE